jgi:hypothetical protein
MPLIKLRNIIIINFYYNYMSISSHKDLEKYIETVYRFNNLWKEKCSKYEIEQQPHILPPVDRIIVIGDLHGDWEMTLKVLQIAKVIDKDGDWIGGDTVIVQVGDQIDRCRYSGIPCNDKNATKPDEGNDWKILQYFTKLHIQALKVGGAVYSLLGNHELMNVKGDFRYVSYEGLQEFNNYNVIDKKGNKIEFKNGEDARRWAFTPGNPISEFLACTRQVALIIGSNLFVHAGVLPKIAKKYNVKNLNQLMSLYLWDELKKPAKYRDVFESSDYSPLWNRVFGNMGKDGLKGNISSTKCDNILDPLKDIYKVDKIYVGHTPFMENGISSICNGRIWLTDYGLSTAFDKYDKSETEDRSSTRQAQVLEILKDGKEINILK